MSIKLETGPRRPIKKLPRWIWAGIAILYIMLWGYAFMHVWRKNLPAAMAGGVAGGVDVGGAVAGVPVSSTQYTNGGDWPVIIAFVLAVAGLVVYYKWLLPWLGRRDADEVARLGRVRRYGNEDGCGVRRNA